MRDVLCDMVRQTRDFFEQIKIIGTPEVTRLEAWDRDGSLILRARLAVPLAELAGEFGITQLAMFDGLLSHAPYKAERATFLVHRERKGGTQTVTSFEFRDQDGQGAVFRTMAAHLIPRQLSGAPLPWEAGDGSAGKSDAFVTVTPSKSKIDEFSQLARLFADSRYFQVSTQADQLIFSLGERNANTHHGSMMFASGLHGDLTNQNLRFDTAQFLGLTRLARALPLTVHVTGRGALGLVMTTPTAHYSYSMRARLPAKPEQDA